ncbi:MAG: hypothetical protein ACKOZX_17035 [Gammaproteobacteria bacterium]
MIRAGAVGRYGLLAAALCLSWGVVRAESAAPDKFYVEDIKAAMALHIERTNDAQGVFHLIDDKTGEPLALRFVKIHDPVRQIDASTYFACTDFAVVGHEDKLYDIDFWLRPAGDRLEVYDTRVHKEPRKSLLYGWYKQPRYTFVNDRVVELY